MNGVIKMLIGIALVGLMYWKLPMLELLMGFLYLCIVPLAFLSGIGLIGAGTIEALGSGPEGLLGKVQARVAEHRHNLNNPPPVPADAYQGAGSRS